MGFLLLFPLAVAAVIALFRNGGFRKTVIYIASIAIAGASIALVVLNLGTTGEYFDFESEIVNVVCTIVDFLIGAIVAYLAWRYKKWLALGLALIQIVVAAVFVAGGWEETYPVTQSLYIDSLTLLMTAIIGVVGCSIAVYAIGYMDDHHETHPETKDRRARFFALFFIFLSAMYLIVFSNNMIWMFTGWEVTTVCSFLLIGYDQNQVSITNAFRQIVMNMLGGIAFCCALIYWARFCTPSASSCSSPAALPLRRWCLFRSCASHLPASRKLPRCRSTPGCLAQWSRPRRRPRCSTARRWSRPASSCC